MKLSNLRLEDIYVGFFLFSSSFFIIYFLVKPVYIISTIGIFLGYYYSRYKLNKLNLITGFLFLSYLLFHFIFLKSDIGIVYISILSILIFPIYNYISSKLTIVQLDNFFLFSFLYFFVESFWRINNPIFWRNNMDVAADDSGWFYPYKLNSFIFQDSNFVALHLYCIFFVALFYSRKKYIFLFFLLILFTFSRSAILASILTVLYFLSEINKFKKIIKPIFIVLLFIFLLFIYKFFDNIDDGSFLSKFYIFETVYLYVLNNFNVFDYLFGIGLNHSYDKIGIGAHNIFVVTLFETGVIGLIIYIMYFFSFFSNHVFSKRQKKALFAFLMCFFLMGMSLGLYLFPIMVLTIALILGGLKHG